ncbi:MAG TPA: inositol monophosphatase [Nevskiaceae bacterium]|nr:inositol monophosphatase [Nevskiaceae bacterium]
MTPTLDYLHQANREIRKLLITLRPQLLAAHGAIAHEHKEDKSVVTELDRYVEERLRDALHRFDPGVGFGGEETGADYTQKTFWLVDPIDGTELFIRGIPHCTNMVMLISQDQPVLSVIYNFVLDEYYLAIKNQGATRNGHRIQVSDRPLSRAYISLYGDAGLNFPGTGDRLRAIVAGMPKAHASGREYTWVAGGATDGTICFSGSGNGHIWDHAPGAFMIQEAGGRVANIGSTAYDYRNTNLVAANPVIFDDLMRFITAATTRK